MAKRAAAGTLALAVCLTGGIVSAGAANAATGFKFDTRVAGEDRYLTSVEASKAAFPTGASSVVITNGLSEVDGLTASYVAGLHSAPILYTSGSATISAAVQAEITRLKPTTVYIVGGETVVTKTVEDALKATAGVTSVVRYGGADRYETAAKVAVSGTAKPAKVIVASGVSFADALVAGPVAYKQKYPILLTAATGVPSYTAAALTTLAVPTVNVVGGTTVVTDATYTAVGGDKRLAGETRQETAIAVAKDSIANEGFSSANVALVGNTNANAADALVAAPLAAQNNTPILFIDNAGTAKPTASFLVANSPLLTGKGYVFGGTAAVSAEAVTAATTAATTSPAVGNATLAIAPSEAVALTVADEAGTTPTSDDRVYTVAGLDNSLKYRVTLVAAANIAKTTAGIVSFKQDAATGLVDPGTVASDITAVNGVPTGTPAATQTVGGIAPSAGSINFRVDADGYEALVPVVYVDGGASTRLEIDSNGLPKEAFGLGGAIAVLPIEQTTAASVTNAIVTDVFADGSFVATTSVAGPPAVVTPKFYKFDSSDAFTVDGAQATSATFKTRLTVGDTIAVTDYQRDPSLRSTFALSNVGPATVTGTAAAGERSVVLTIPANQVVTGSTVTAYYAVDTTPATLGTPAYSTSFASKTATADEDPTTAGYQITVSGLTPSTAYEIYLSQTTNGDESAKTNLQAVTTADTLPVLASVNPVTPNDVNDGVGSTNQLVVTFDQEVSFLDVTKLTFSPNGQANFVFTGASAVKANTAGTKWTVTFDKTIQDSSADVTYNVVLGASTVQDVSAQKNAAATGTFLY